MASAPLRVFVVEDEPVVGKVIEGMLLKLGHVVVANVGELEEAVRLAESIDLDVAILDVNIAGRRVYPVAEALRKRGCPFLFVSGFSASEIDSAFQDVATLPKPFLISDLEKAIELMATPRS